MTVSAGSLVAVETAGLRLDLDLDRLLDLDLDRLLVLDRDRDRRFGLVDQYLDRRRGFVDRDLRRRVFRFLRLWRAASNFFCNFDIALVDDRRDDDRDRDLRLRVPITSNVVSAPEPDRNLDLDLDRDRYRDWDLRDLDLERFTGTASLMVLPFLNESKKLIHYTRFYFFNHVIADISLQKKNKNASCKGPT